MPERLSEERLHRNFLALGALGVGAAVFFCYARALGYGFYFADLSGVVSNPGFEAWRRWRALPGWGERWESLGELFAATPPLRPLTQLSLLLDYTRWGAHPLGYHQSNLTLHVLSALTLYFLAHWLLRRPSPAAAAGGGKSGNRGSLVGALAVALLFALHPIQVEAVVYISARAVLLAGLLEIVSLALLLYALRESLAASPWGLPRLAAYLAGSVGYLLALVAHPSSWPLPLYLALCDWGFLARAPAGGAPRGVRLRFYAPLGLLLALAGWVGRSPLALAGAAGSAPGAYDVLATHAVLFWEYLRLLVFPVGLSVDHGFPTWPGPFALAPLMSIFALAAALAGLGYLARRGERALAAAGGGLFVSLLATVGATAWADPLAERRAYVPAAWLAVLVLIVWRRLASARVCGGERAPPPLPYGLRRLAAPALLGLVGAACVARVGVWRSQERLWADAVAKNPAGARAHYQLGNAYLGAGRSQEALDEFGEALRRDPSFFLAALNRGVLLLEGGDLANAELNFWKVLDVRPGYLPALYNLAVLFEKQRRYDEALAVIYRAEAVEPPDATLYEKEGNLLEAQGRVAEALDRYSLALEQGPKGEERSTLLARMARLAFEQGYFDTAAKRFEQLALENPESSEAHYNLGVFYEKRGRVGEAVAAYHKALILDPANAQAHYNLARLFEKQGKCDQALAHYRLAAVYEPRYRQPWQDYLQGREEGERCKGGGPF